MNTCPTCNTVTSGKKTYCSNACRQKAYRTRRNVTVKKVEDDSFEFRIYDLVEDWIKYHKGPYSHIPSIDEYLFVRKLYPSKYHIDWIATRLLELSKEIRYSLSDSLYKTLFEEFLRQKVKA
ncbi:MAG: hypothetical protein JXR19_11050 [Bacteroidia bacterium]